MLPACDNHSMPQFAMARHETFEHRHHVECGECETATQPVEPAATPIMPLQMDLPEPREIVLPELADHPPDFHIPCPRPSLIHIALSSVIIKS